VRVCRPVVYLELFISAVEPAFVGRVGETAQVGQAKPPVQQAVKVPVVVALKAFVAGRTATLHVLLVRNINTWPLVSLIENASQEARYRDGAVAEQVAAETR